MLGLFIRAVVVGAVIYLVYMKGFTDCMFGYNNQLFDRIKEWYIDKYGEDIWSDD